MSPIPYNYLVGVHVMVVELLQRGVQKVRQGLRAIIWIFVVATIALIPSAIGIANF